MDRRPASTMNDDRMWTSVDLALEADALGQPLAGATRERAARSLFQTETLGAVLTNLADGSFMENEQPDEPVTIQVVRGTCRITLGDERSELRAGTLVAVSAGVVWRLEATSPATVLVTVASPRR